MRNPIRFIAQLTDCLKALFPLIETLELILVRTVAAAALIHELLRPLFLK
jgi:hypothetical protein